MQGKEDLVRADFFGLNKLELGYDRIDAMLYTNRTGNRARNKRK